MTDATGRKVDFRNAVIVMTSNVGARRIGRNVTVGFQRDTADEVYESMKSRVMEEVKKVFNPEFLNRVDEVLVFRRLTYEQLVEVVDIQVNEVVERLAEKGLHLILTQDAKEFIVQEGTDDEYGARPLRRAVQQYIEDPLAEVLLKAELEPGTEVVVRPSAEEKGLLFEPAVPIAEGTTS